MARCANPAPGSSMNRVQKGTHGGMSRPGLIASMVLLGSVVCMEVDTVCAVPLTESSSRLSFAEVVKANRDSIVQVSAEISKYKKLYYDYTEPRPKRPFFRKGLDMLLQATCFLACVVPCTALDQIAGLLSGGDPVRRIKSRGTGFVVFREGYILTNFHVVGYADQVRVTFLDGTIREGRVTGREIETDLAMIKVMLDPHEELRPVTFGDPDDVEVGDLVVAIGNPLGLDQTVTTGVISSLSRKGPYVNYLQTDAALNPGSSGGPLLLSDGRVVGVTTAVIAQAQNLGFAIPTDVVLPVIEALKHGDVRRGSIGVDLTTVREQKAHAPGMANERCYRITYVDPKGPGGEAGLKEGDMVCAVDGTTYDTKVGLLTKIASSRPGTTLKLTIVRNGASFEVHVRVAELRRRGPDELAP